MNTRRLAVASVALATALVYVAIVVFASSRTAKTIGDGYIVALITVVVVNECLNTKRRGPS